MKAVRPFWLWMLELLARLNDAWQVLCTFVRDVFRRLRLDFQGEPGHESFRIAFAATLFTLCMLLIFTVYALHKQEPDKNWEGVKFHCAPLLVEPQRCRDAFERYMGNPRKPR